MVNSVREISGLSLVAGKESHESLWAPGTQNVRLKVLLLTCPALTCPLFPAVPEDSLLLNDSPDRAGSASGVRSPHTHTSTMLTRSGERTLRSLGLSHAATHPVHPTLRGNVTEHTGLLSRAPTLGGVFSHSRIPWL